MKEVLVFGGARSGVAAARLLRQNGWSVIITDQKEILEKGELQALGIEVLDGGHPDSLYRSFDLVVKNPGIPYRQPLIAWYLKMGIEIISELEVVMRYRPHYVYGAITGTNGKTTITTLLSLMLKKKSETAVAAGNIGTPLSAVALQDSSDTKRDIALEISAFQLVATPSLSPKVSLITNLTPDHLDYFDSLDAYYQAKNLVYRNQKGDDWFLYNIDDRNVVETVFDLPCKAVSVSLLEEADLCGKDNEVTLFGEFLFDASRLQIVGLHNRFNAMCAAAMAVKMGVALDDIREVLYSFAGVEHRIEFVAELDGVKYYNDSKGTNVDSTITALKAFDKPVLLLAGGYDKKTGFDELFDYRDKIKKLYVFGDTKAQLAELKADAVICQDMKEALTRAARDAKSGDVVLLSPACASYDQFKNYEERGRLFKQYVNDLKRGQDDGLSH